MKLLYAEDEPAMAEAVTDILTYHHYLVDAVSDGEEALAYARAEAYDGIILDVMMPKLDGLAVLDILRGEGCRTPVLLITAKGEVEDRIRGLGSFQLSCGDQSVTLPKMEYRLMESLMRNQGLYLSSEELLIKVWGYDAEVEVGTVWVYVSYLRKRLTALGSQVTLKAKRGIGYTLEVGP